MKFQIVIPTLGRIRKQKTYSAIPDKFKKLVTFVIQPHEEESFKNEWPEAIVKVLPIEINRIQTTRQWIYDNFEGAFWVIDDDIKFKKRIPVPDDSKIDNTRWEAELIDEEGFKTILQFFADKIRKGYFFGAVEPSWTIPSIRYFPFKTSTRLTTNMFFYKPGLEKAELDFTRVPFGEDIDVCLQLLSQGYNNVSLTEYVALCTETNSKGGCSTHRDLEKHNDSQRLLASLWPDYIQTKMKVGKSGDWNGKEKVSLKVLTKKVYTDSLLKLEASKISKVLSLV